MTVIIFIVFAVIAYFDWRYLKHNNRSKRAIMKVMSTAVVLLIAMETIYVLKDRWTIGMLFDAIFSPIQKLLFVEP